MSDHSSRVSRPPSPNIDPPSTARPYRFTWDTTAGHRAGPGSVSETTEGGPGNLFVPQPRPDLFNSSITSLALGALPNDWSSSKHGFHAISTVLNNPHKQQAPPKAHSSLPPIVPAELPRVRRKDFDSYLRAVAPEWSRFQRHTISGHAVAAPLNDHVSSNAPSPSEPPTPRSPHLPNVTRPIPPLASVPSVFFDRNFNLGDPRTFDSVTEQNPDPDLAVDPSSPTHSTPLLEKFSQYADTVEQHLVQEISLRSTSFFAALTNLRELQLESEQCLSRIGILRTLLQEVDENGAKRGLEIVWKESRLRNLNVVREGVGGLSGVVEMTGVAKTLVSGGQWNEALGVIGDLEALWSVNHGHLRPKVNVSPLDSRLRNAGSSPLPPASEYEIARVASSQTIPLSTLRAFAALPTHLRNLTVEITASLTSELVNILRLDLVERINGTREPSSHASNDINQSLQDRLRPVLNGLTRTKGIREATLSWGEAVMEEVRVTLKQRVSMLGGPVSVSGGSELSPDLSAQLRIMSHADFISLLQGIYSSLLNSVKGLQTQGNIIVEVLASNPNPPNIPPLEEEFADILSSAAELCNTRAATVVSMRSEQHAQLDLPEFLVLFNESWNFVLRCEIICRRMIVGLRGVIVGQAKAFLQTFHQARISHSAKLVEDEQWAPSEVAPTLQQIVNVLVECAIRDPGELVLTSAPTVTVEASQNGSANESLTSPPPVPPPKSNGASPSAKQLRIEDGSYFTVSATSAVLSLLSDYLKVIVNLPMLTMDTMSKVIEFLKAFNSRTCQVVLGAGAMRSAGLKNITAKHLSLASQSLSIMIALIPYVRETFRRHLSSQQAVILVEFDKLKRDYQEHQNEIHTKLIAIMGDRLSAHIKTLQAVQWDVPKPGGGVNDYMELLVKETVTLHKVLSRYLTVPVLEYVMSQVYAAINHRLSEEYARIELPTQEVKDRLLVDARYLQQRLSMLKNVGAMSGMLETVVAEKSVAGRKQIGLPIATPSPAVPSSAAPPTLKERLASKMLSPASLMEKALPAPEFATTPPLSGNANNGYANSPLGSPGEDGGSPPNEVDLQEKDFGETAPPSPQP